MFADLHHCIEQHRCMIHCFHVYQVHSVHNFVICFFLLLSPALFFPLTTEGSGHTGSLPSPADTICTIVISGNKKTETSVVQHLSQIRIGITTDTLLAASVKHRLMQTGLFSKVDVLLHTTPSGTRVYILVSEKFYFLPYDFGGELYSYRYGQKTTWWRMRVGMEYNNFRGKAEVLRTSFSFWDWKSLGIGWYKPLLPSPYYLSAGMSADLLPDEIFKIDHTILRSSATFGRKLPKNSRLDASISPMYRRRILFDSTLIPYDTMRVYEAFSVLKFRTDHRDRLFNPANGWVLSIDMRTNALYTKIAPSFTQFSADLRRYLPGILPSHTIAFRSTITLRDTDAGVTHRLLMGGEGTVRGYGRNQFGLYFYANNSFTASCEYRFPLYTLTNVPLYPLDQFVPELSSITYRLDGALILDYGRVSAEYSQLFSIDGQKLERGTGVGGAFRLVVPELEHSICFDVLWGTNPWAKRGYLTFMEKPAWHFYLDTYF